MAMSLQKGLRDNGRTTRVAGQSGKYGERTGEAQLMEATDIWRDNE